MRKILFRGKRVDNGEWIFGSIVHQTDYYGSRCDTWSILEGVDTCVYDIDYPIVVQKETVGMYTGLTDKNGKKIFEGDILLVKQCGETGSRICRVYFGEYIDADSNFDDYRCIGFYVKTSDGCCTIGALLSEEFEFEVIGNIYDNPELLKGNKT